MMVAIALGVFPKLALGLSGFQTGVAVMPHVRGDATDSEQKPTGRIRHQAAAHHRCGDHERLPDRHQRHHHRAHPPAAFQTGGPANGRALAYLAHENLGSVFGTVYDLSTIAILWFAGASAMAGLLNLVPRYLPRYGMAPTGPAPCARWCWSSPPLPP